MDVASMEHMMNRMKDYSWKLKKDRRSKQKKINKKSKNKDNEEEYHVNNVILKIKLDQNSPFELENLENFSKKFTDVDFGTI